MRQRFPLLVLAASLTLATSGCRDRQPLDWVSIPDGTFEMGNASGDADEQPVHPVRVRGFEMMKSEVTVGQYRECVEAGACTPPDTSSAACDQGASNWSGGREDHPVNCVDWHQARAFAVWVDGRLPTEAEWEYAARAAQGTPYAGSNDAGEVAWYTENAGGKTHPIKGKLPNAWGLHDMSGNVWEWTQDHYHATYQGAPGDGSAWEDHAPDRVIRGGCWARSANSLRATNRLRDAPAASPAWGSAS